MHLAPSRIARLAASRHVPAPSLETSLPHFSDLTETGLAYVTISVFWGVVLYFILAAIGS